MGIEGTGKRIYLDYAASTPVDGRVVDFMDPLWRECFANPYSTHRDGERARGVLEDARKLIGQSIGIPGGVSEKNLVFTSGGTESNALAIRGVLERAGREKGFERVRFLTSPIEHPSILEIGKWFEVQGGHVDFLPVNGDGLVDLSDIPEKVSEDTVLVSIQMVNSEIGTLQPVRECVKRIKKISSDILVHCDASQALLWMPIDVEKLGVDLLTIDAHKVYGPKGVGALYIRKGVALEPLFYGASENSVRPGTPAVPLAAGFAEAVRIVGEEREEYAPRVAALRDWLMSEISERFPTARINGSRSERVANNTSISFTGANHEFLQVALDEKGISIATRSACLEKGGEGSEVISSLAAHDEKSALRITLGRETNKEDIDRLLMVLGEIDPNR